MEEDQVSCDFLQFKKYFLLEGVQNLEINQIFVSSAFSLILTGIFSFKLLQKREKSTSKVSQKGQNYIQKFSKSLLICCFSPQCKGYFTSLPTMPSFTSSQV